MSTFIHVMALHNKPKQCKAFNKDINKELMPVTWYPTRWDNWLHAGRREKI